MRQRPPYGTKMETVVALNRRAVHRPRLCIGTLSLDPEQRRLLVEQERAAVNRGGQKLGLSLFWVGRRE